MNKNFIYPKLSFIIFTALAAGLLFQPQEAKGASKLIEFLFDEGSGTVLHDSSGSGINAAITGATWTKLPTGKWTLSFNGSGNKASCNYSPSLDLSGIGAKVTMEAWVNISQYKSSMWMGNGSGGSGGGYALYYHQPSGKVAGYIEGLATSSANPNYGWKALAYGETAPETNHWYHVVYTYDGQYGRIYLNGTLSAQSSVWTGGIFANAYHDPFQVYNNFAGMFGKISVYDYVLSPDQIQSNYRSEIVNYYQLSVNPTIFVYPAITDNKILPNTIISNQYISNNISLSGSPGEYRPASFVIYAGNNASSVIATISNLTGSGGTIGSNAVDIRVVKAWYQAGTDIWVGSGKQKLLTPELLLKDDSLVRVDGQENYLKLTSGNYIWISEINNLPSYIINTVSDIPVRDSASLLPVDIPAYTNKQFWITIKIPETAAAGTYNGTIQLNSSSGQIGSLQLALTVLPIKLADSYLDYSIYYRGQLNSSWPQGSISSEWKSEAQLGAELKNMFEHGVTSPTVYQTFNATLLGKVLTMRNNIGMGGKPLYYLGVSSGGTQPSSQVTQTISLARSYGISDVYFYGIDEAKGDELAAQRASWQGIRSAGGKMFVSGYTANMDPPGNFSLMGDIQDLLICAGNPDPVEAAKWHSVNHRIFDYANPQVGEEKPETYRRNFGLLLWQKDYDGAMDYAYQHSFGSIWNDFDHNVYRDHNFTYPTLDGVIDTIQWEGFREGVNDVRYLTTLLDTVEKAKTAGINTSAAETWISNLKSSNLAASNLDTVRSDMINQIITLQNQTPSCISCNLGTPTINPTSPLANQTFTMTCPTNGSGYDCIDAYANGSSNKCTFSSYSGNNALYTCTGLTAGTYTSRCVSKTGTSRNCCASEKIVSYTVQAAPDTTAPSQITNLSTSNFTQTSVVLNWTSPGDDATTGTVASYDIRYSTALITSSNWTTATQVTGEPAPLISGTIQSFTVTGLAASATYYFAIKAIDEASNTATLSNVPSGKTLAAVVSDTTPPSQITNLYTSNLTQNSITLNWTSPGDDATAGTATSYDIRRSAVLITSSTWASITQVSGEPTPLIRGTAQSYTVTGLSASTTYYFAIKAIDEANNISLLSNVVSGKTLASTTADTTPPTRSSSQPTGTLAAGTTQATISLSTNESATCKYGTVSGTAYASMTGTFTTTGGSSHSKTITGLTNGSSYTYYVRCIDSSNNANTNDFAISFSVSLPSCVDCGLGTPIINPTSPLTSQTFTMTCPANASGYDCIDAYANGSSNKCTFSSYSGNNAVYTCTGLTAGSYTSRCEAKTGTSRNCCANVKTGSYIITDPVVPPVTPPPTTGGGEPTVTPTSTTPANITQLQALIQQLLAQVAALQAQLSAAQGVPSQFRFNNPLYLGLRNDDVKQLQIFLTGQGTTIYPEAKITGYYGLLTRKAVIRFQLKYNIIVSEYSPGAGMVGIKTRTKINAMMGK